MKQLGPRLPALSVPDGDGQHLATEPSMHDHAHASRDTRAFSRFVRCQRRLAVTRPSKVMSKVFNAAFVRREALLFEWGERPILARCCGFRAARAATC
jgi:hypothetical protein